MEPHFSLGNRGKLSANFSQGTFGVNLISPIPQAMKRAKSVGDGSDNQDSLKKPQQLGSNQAEQSKVPKTDKSEDITCQLDDDPFNLSFASPDLLRKMGLADVQGVSGTKNHYRWPFLRLVRHRGQRVRTWTSPTRPTSTPAMGIITFASRRQQLSR